jgi:DNA repair protein SbcC/Rad50
MFSERIFRSPLHHADPSRRVSAVAKLPPDSDELAALLATDPAAEVRIAAANGCGNLRVLAAARENESDPAVRAAIAAALVTLLAESQDHAQATALLGAAQCTDVMRADVARRATNVERRRSAIAAIREEALLVELALTAEHASTRMAAAEQVRTPDGLRKLADTARDKDRGVARLARKQLGAMENHEGNAVEADAILARLEALQSEPGPILTSVIELNRRWQALNLSDDPARLARCHAARRTLQARFDREHAAQQARMQFEHGLSEWLGRADPPDSSGELDVRRSEVEALRAQGREYAETSVLARLDEAQRRVEAWAEDLQARAGAEALVIEAEQLALGTSIDDANLPERWQALDQSIRTSALTRRFEAALIVIGQGRLAQVRAAEQETHSSRQQLHMLLHGAEQALAAGQLQAARAAAEEIRTRRPGAGLLPKPTLQRLSRLTQQLKALEGWESFGQHQARIQLCERAETAATLTLDAPHLAAEVRKLRKEWSALDQLQGTVPKPLSERFDRACAKAYAPAARHFAEQAALQKQLRKQREAFIAAAAAQAPTLLVEPRDWRAIERWLRETDGRWRDGALGSMDPKSWRILDARFKDALAPLRDALSTARAHAKVRRLALIEEAVALAAQALERDAPAKVKDIQAQWQAQAKQLALTQRDERVLWEQFRAACDAIFQAREAKSQQEGSLMREARAALENICVQLEQLASATDKQEQDLRRGLRDLEEQWTRRARTSGSASRGLESRFKNAKMTMEAALSARARSRETDVWRTLAAKERLCEELDRRLCSGEGTADVGVAHVQWTALTALPAAWEKAMLGRRDAALRAIVDKAVAAAHVIRIDRGGESRGEILLELELLLGLESPPEVQTQRRALQLKRLRDRFQGAAPSGADNAGERLLAWCAQPGIADDSDRRRCERVFSAIESKR